MAVENLRHMGGGGEAARVTGAMLWFNEAKGFGFILTDEGERIRVYEDGFSPGQVPVGRCARLPVELTTAERDGERVAIAVSAVVPKDVGRARRRHATSRTL